MKLSWIWSAAAALAMGLGLPTASTAACKLQAVAEYHLTMNGAEALVDGQINGKPVRLLFDTGASSMVITAAASSTLNMPHKLVAGLHEYDVNGAGQADVAIAQDFTLGNQTAHQIPFMVGLGDLRSDEFQGLLGEDILDQGDLELDFADSVARIFKPTGCVGDQVVYWGAAYSTVPIAPSNDPTDLNLYITVGGHQELASLDTGAGATVVTSRAAAQLGMVPQGNTAETDAVAPNVNIGGEIIKSPRLHVQNLFANATETVTGSMLPEKVGIYPDVLLGADFVRAHRIYIARSQGLIYFSYSGGPVFRTAEQSPTPGLQPERPGPTETLPHP